MFFLLDLCYIYLAKCDTENETLVNDGWQRSIDVLFWYTECMFLCSGLWYDYAGSYTLVFPVLGAPLLVGGALLFLLPYVAPVSLHN